MNLAPHVPTRALTIAPAAATDLPVVVELLFREYGRWVVARRLQENASSTFTAADLSLYHAAFWDELDALLGPRGQGVLVARVDGQPVGVGALEPVDDTIAEITRMYVRPAARRGGVGRALLGRLVHDARTFGFSTIRLETLWFMRIAQAMYRAAGFVEIAPGDGSATPAVEPLTVEMQLDLTRP